MLGGRYCTPIVERPKPHYLYHINGIGRNRPGPKLDADSQLSFFSPHRTPNRSTGKCTTQRGELILYFSFIARGSLPSRFFMPQCVRPEPKRERFEALMALESDLERPKKRRWKPWPRVPPARSVTGCSRFREVRWSRRSRRFSNRPSRRSKNLPPRIPPIFSIPPDLIKARDRP
jgi:hypothetical protein